MKKRFLFVLVGILLCDMFLCAQNVSKSISLKPDLFYLVVDKSGSIADNKLIEPIKNAIYNATDNITRRDTEVHVVIFSDPNPDGWHDEFSQYPFDNDAKRKLNKFVDEKYMIPINEAGYGMGWTPLYITAAEVFRRVWKCKDNYNRIDIVFLTDGINYYPPDKKYKKWDDVIAVLPDMDWIKEQRKNGIWNAIWYVVEGQKISEEDLPPKDVIETEEINREDLKGFERPPRAAFRLNPATVEENQSVMFALNSTIGVSEVEWHFGDSSPIIKQTNTMPVYHQYVNAGEYSAKVIVRGPAGSEEEMNKVTVLKVVPLKALFSYPKVIRVNQEFQFVDESIGGPESYEWDIQGDSISKEHNPIKTFSRPGDFKVTLTVKKADKTAQHTETIKVLPELPKSSFDVSPSVVEMGQIVTMKAKNHKDGWQHHWVIGNKHQFDGVEAKWEADILDAVQIIHSVEDEFGGKSEDSERVFVKPQPDAIVAGFTWSPEKPRVGDTIRFVDESHGAPAIWEWQIGDQPVMTQRNPTIVFDKEGDVTVTLVVKADGRKPSECKQTITILPKLVSLAAAFKIGKTSGKTPLSVQFTDLSQGDISSWHWDFGDGATSDIQNPVHVYEIVGTFNPRLTIKNSLGAEAKDSGGISLTTSAPMTTFQKILIGLGIFIAVWVLFVARFILAPNLLPQKGVVLQGSARFQLRKLAEKGFLRWLIWPRNSITVGTGKGIDISIYGHKTGKLKIFAEICRNPFSSTYSIKACEDAGVAIVRDNDKTSLNKNGVFNLRNNDRIEFHNNDRIEFHDVSFTWCQLEKKKHNKSNR